MNTSIAIITATLNSSEHIQSCIDSVISQTYKNIEYIVIDGNSSDGTIEIVNKNIGYISFFLTSIDSGIYEALNKGINISNSDVIGFLHSDDYLASNDIIQNIASAFNEDSSLCAVYGDLAYVERNETDKIIRLWKSTPFTNNMIKEGWMPPHPTLYVKREWYIKIGGFDESYKISADYLSVLNFFNNRDFKSKYLPEMFVKMRLGGMSNKSIKSIILKSKEDLKALRSIDLSLIKSLKILFQKNFQKLSQYKMLNLI